MHNLVFAVPSKFTLDNWRRVQARKIGGMFARRNPVGTFGLGKIASKLSNTITNYHRSRNLVIIDID